MDPHHVLLASLHVVNLENNISYLGIVPEKLLIRFNFPTLLTRDFDRARMLEDGSIPTCLSAKYNHKKYNKIISQTHPGRHEK